MTRTLCFAAAAGACLLLVGCVGSNVPYRPGYQPRPESDMTEDEAIAAARANEIPVDIERSEWQLYRARREIERIRESMPRNSWQAYESDLRSNLGEYANAYLTRDPAAEAMAAAAAAEDDGDEGGFEGGGDDDPWDDGEEDDW